MDGHESKISRAQNERLPKSKVNGSNGAKNFKNVDMSGQKGQNWTFYGLKVDGPLQNL